MILPEMSGPEASGPVPGIAVLGLSGRFPGGGGPAELWSNLRAGRDWNVAADRRLDTSGFDAALFGLPEATADAMEPRHRLFLECAWEAFEHAGYCADRVEGPVAVFVAPGPASPGFSGDRELLAPLVSRLLSLTGPSMDVHTDGGASLASVHLACQSLLSGECDLALAGGGAFGPSATACVVLKRLDDAVRDGDRVLAVIRGSAINHSSTRRAGDGPSCLTGQVRVIGEALAVAGVHPVDLSYLDVHRGGTGGGAPIELVALTRAFRASTVATQFCVVGTVEAQGRQTDQDAGIVGLIKVVLALGHCEIPPTRQAATPGPDAHVEHSPFLVTTTPSPWTIPAGGRRIAGVAVLSETGTNLLLIVEEAPEVPPAAPSREHHLLVLSARTPAALETATAHLASHLADNAHMPLGDVAYTLLEGRQPMAHRRVVVAVDADDAAHALRAAGRVTTDAAAAEAPQSVAWMCPGGASYRGMGAGLYQREPAYRAALDEALAALDGDLAAGVRHLVCVDPHAAGGVVTEGMPLAVPALVAVEYAVGRLLQSWGVTPTAVAGAGPGELAAACFAGVIDIQHAMALAAFECRQLERQDADASPEAFLQLCRTIPFMAPTTRLISNMTGGWMTDAEATDADSWARRLPRTGDVVDGWPSLMTLRHGIFIEVGPGQTLADLARRQSLSPRLVTTTLRRPDESESDVAFLLTAVGRLWSVGTPLDARGLFVGERRRRVALPTYPFERQSCRREPDPLAPPQSAARATVLRSDQGDGATGSERGHASAGPSPAQVERELLAMWRAVLERDEVETGANFFDLGGHSLNAVQLARRIRDRFDVDLPLATLFEAPTIAQLGVLLRERIAERLAAPATRTDEIAAVVSTVHPALRSLVTVQRGEGRTPLFVVHGAGGNVLNIHELARAMDSRQTVLGLQAAGLDGVSPLGTSIAQMAADYLAEVRAVQPHGPYLLAGYSGGGVIAFEMARRLQASGDTIGVLAFIDTFHPQMKAPRINLFTRLGRLCRERAGYLRDVLERRRLSIRDERGWRRIERHLAAGEPIPIDLRELHLIRNFLRASSGYQPEPWPGKALLFRAEQVDYYHRAGGPTYGWDQTVLGGLETVSVPGDHDSIMRGANAARIAHRLEQAIAEATNPPAQDRRG
jgi:acyl transferase domain-containing protein